MKKQAIIITIGVVAATGIGMYLYSRKRDKQDVSQVLSTSGSISQNSATNSTPTGVQDVRQTMWKDRDGNVFEMTSEKQRWGNTIKVNGSVQRKTNQLVLMLLGPDGYMIGADNNGSVFVYKNGGWQYVVRDNKSEASSYLSKYGATYNGYLGSIGLGKPSAYILN